jgi:2-keto-3-deoxy-L-arabinonate dehydratase
MERAGELYRDVLPLLVFLMESIDNFLVYGKHLFAQRPGIEGAEARPPCGSATKFGMACVRRDAELLASLR